MISNNDEENSQQYDRYYVPLEEIPIGYRFKPSDQEIVIEYLMKKAQSIRPPPSIIQDIDAKDFYDKHPRQLVTDVCKTDVFKHGESEWYFFIKQDPNETCPKHTRYIRNGSGYWKMDGSEVCIFDHKRTHVASKYNLRFFTRPRQNVPKKKQWRMTEFRLAKPSPSAINNKNTGWTLIKLMREEDDDSE